MEQKVQYSTVTNEIDGLLEGTNLQPEGENMALADPPIGYDDTKRILWKWNGADAIEMKTGQELIDAMTIVNLATVQRLLGKYFPANQFTNSPISIGQIEGAADIFCQVLHKLVNGIALTQDEIDAWNSFYTKCSPYFKVTFATLPAEEDGMAAAKAAARQNETDMKNDPDWPT